MVSVNLCIWHASKEYLCNYNKDIDDICSLFVSVGKYDIVALNDNKIKDWAV